MRLANGLVALLVSDADADEAGAALSVHQRARVLSAEKAVV